MKLEQIQIKNVKSFKEETPIQFHGSLNLLIGTNAGGKSNLLDILTIVMRRHFLRGYSLVDESDARGPRKRIDRYDPFSGNYQQLLPKFTGDSSPSTIAISFRAGTSDLKNLTVLLEKRQEIEKRLKTYTNGQELLFKFLDGWTIERLKTEFVPDSKGKLYTFHINEGNLQPATDPAQRLFIEYMNCFELASILDSQHDLGLVLTSCYYYFSPNRSVSPGSFDANLSQNSYGQTMRTYSEAHSRSGTEVATLGTLYLAAKLRRYEVEANDTGYANRWNEDKDIKLLKQHLKNLGYDWILRLFDPNRNLYHGDLMQGGQIVDIERTSSGEKEVLNFIFGIFARKLIGGILIIDEPELHLHPQWQTWLLGAFMDICGQYENQIIVATHSGTFITPESISNVLRVYKDDQLISRVVSVPEGSAVSTREKLHMFNAHNNQKMFFADIVVLVEGIKDRLIFERLIKLYKSGVEGQRVIEILEVHGKTNLQIYREFLMGIKVRVFEIADLDYIVDVASHLANLFETDYQAISQRVIEDKKSLDRKSLTEQLEMAVQSGNLEDLRKTWEYIKRRHRRLRQNLTSEELTKLTDFLDASRGQNRLILSKGEIEDYLPDNMQSLDQVLHLTSAGKFESWLTDTWEDKETAELREIARTVTGIDLEAEKEAFERMKVLLTSTSSA